MVWLSIITIIMADQTEVAQREIAGVLTDVNLDLERVNTFIDKMTTIPPGSDSEKLAMLIQNMSELKLCFTTLQQMGSGMTSFADQLQTNPNVAPTASADLTRAVSTIRRQFNANQIKYGDTVVESVISKLTTSTTPVSDP